MPDDAEPGHHRPPRAQTRKRVLEAAYAVFGERGVAGTSVAQVAAAAGLTKGAVYSSFRSKDELLLALMEERAMGRLTDAVAGITDAADPRSALAGALQADAAWHRILSEYFALSHHAPTRRAELRRRHRDAREAVAAGIRRITELTGLTPRLPPADLAAVLLALSNGLAVESDIDPDANGTDLLDRVLALLIEQPRA